MTLPLEDTAPAAQTETSDVSIIRREFVDLTGDHFSAVILNQLLYWTLRVRDFDRLLEEERHFQPNCTVSPRHGWIYKTAQELNEETMLGLSPPSIRKYLKLLIDEGWVDEREHPTEKWNKTTQYRVNVRRLQEDLDHQGHSLPEVYLKAFRGTFQRRVLTQQNISENLEETLDEKNFTSKQRIFASSENSEESFEEEHHLPTKNLNQRNFASNEKIFASKERNFASNQKFFASNTENTAKTTHENTNREQLDACAQENFSDFEGSENSISGDSVPDESASAEAVSGGPVSDEPGRDKSLADESVAGEMLKYWKRHVIQNLPPAPAEAENKKLHFAVTRKDELEALFAFHFQNDMRLWERFCLRVKASNFMMGGGESGWYVRLDWILRDGNILKALAGNYDNSKRAESRELKLEKLQANPVLDAEKAAILASIKDPLWKKWCTQLAAGVRLNDFKMLHQPLGSLELQQIAHAWFLEVEDDRLVWIASHDQRVLNKIDGLRLKISWVFAKEYPNARTFRTRLQSTYPSPQVSISHPPLKGPLDSEYASINEQGDPHA